MIQKRRNSFTWLNKHYEIAFLIISVGLTLSFLENISADEVILPSWIKTSAVWWGQDKISDQDFINALQYLIENDLLVILEPQITESKCGPGLVLEEATDECIIHNESVSQEIFNESIIEHQKIVLSMIKTTTLWWGQDKISDQDFINALQYLVENNILTLDDEKLKSQLPQEPQPIDFIAWPQIDRIDDFQVQGHKNTDSYHLQFKLIDIHQNQVSADGTISIVIMDERNRILYLDGFSIKKSDYLESFNAFGEAEDGEMAYSWEIKTSDIKSGFTQLGKAKIVFTDRSGNNFESEYDKVSIPQFN
jgi:hypothetical protein